jgi:hypothetical protein
VSGIEFLPSGEEHDEPAPSARPTHRRWWLLAALVVVLALAGWGLTRPGGGDRGATRAASTPPAAPRVASPPAVRAQGACGGAPSCTVTVDLPAAVSAAIRAHLHLRDIRYTFRRTELAGSFTGNAFALVHRVLVVMSDGASVQVIVGPRGSTGDSAAAASVHQVVAGYAVEVDYLPADGGHHLSATERARLLALARDRRLEAVPPPG